MELKKELLFEIILFIVGIMIISLFYSNNILVSILLIIIWAMAIKLWHQKHDIYFFIAGAIAGPIGEIICIRFGAWQYANPSFFGIPLWLPLAGGFVIMLIKRISETFVKIEMK